MKTVGSYLSWTLSMGNSLTSPIEGFSMEGGFFRSIVYGSIKSKLNKITQFLSYNAHNYMLILLNPFQDSDPHPKPLLLPISIM